jgi:hypothetical protein
MGRVWRCEGEPELPPLVDRLAGAVGGHNNPIAPCEGPLASNDTARD